MIGSFKINLFVIFLQMFIILSNQSLDLILSLCYTTKHVLRFKVERIIRPTTKEARGRTPLATILSLLKFIELLLFFMWYIPPPSLKYFCSSMVCYVHTSYYRPPLIEKKNYDENIINSNFLIL